jgi:DNA repair protein SbcD/Mre11
VLRELEAVFPRWYDREIKEANPLLPTLVDGAPVRSLSFEETVRDYLSRELVNEDEALRNGVLERAELLMKEVQA